MKHSYFLPYVLENLGTENMKPTVKQVDAISGSTNAVNARRAGTRGVNN